MLWGINRIELRFLVQNRFRDISDLRYPVIAKRNFESENYLYYSINERIVFFYFNSDDMFYRAVERFPYGNNESTLSGFHDFNLRTISKIYKNLFRPYGENSHELKWKNADFESGFEHHLYISERQSPFIGHFINIGGLLSGEIPFDDYPELELTSRWEFEGMLIENKLWPNPEDPSLLMREVVFTNTYLSGD